MKINEQKPYATTWMNLTDTMRKNKNKSWTKRVHIVWFYLFSVQNQVKLIYDVRKSRWGLPLVEVTWWKGVWRDLLGMLVLLFLDLVGGYMNAFSLLAFSALCTYDLCTFLLRGYTAVQLKNHSYYLMVTYRIK